MIGIRFECGQEDRMSDTYGPFEWMQQTYTTLRLPPDGDSTIAAWDHSVGMWAMFDPPRDPSKAVESKVTFWSDFVIFPWENQ